ncbi:MAG: HAMP domain-containing sensor histidine kinase [Candidatus Gastranaerophilales bacterium]
MNSELIFQQSRCVAHEIRNHLSICELYSQIIYRNLQNEGVKNQSIENALCCIKKSLKIMSNNLLELKSMNNLQVEKYDLANLLTQSVSMSEIYCNDKNININCDFSDNINVIVDENKFISCVVNIIKNAIEAIKDDGEIKITISKSKNLVSVLIANNGEPISKSKINEIFNIGFTTKSYGSGLGLYICKKNLEEQNIELKLNKSDEICTEFELLLRIVN